MNSAAPADPYVVLGVPRDADETEVRARYLQLVKQFPPERDPERFREIQTAYEAAKDPYVIARHLLQPPGEEIPEWSQTIEAQTHNPPRLSPAFLLSLGNRASIDSTATPTPAHEPHKP